MFLNYNSPLHDDKMVMEHTKCKICGVDISEKELQENNGCCNHCNCMQK